MAPQHSPPNQAQSRRQEYSCWTQLIATIITVYVDQIEALFSEDRAPGIPEILLAGNRMRTSPNTGKSYDPLLI